MIKILTTHDFQSCVDMVGVKPRTSGTTPVNKEDFVDTHYQYFDNLENRYALGYFEENTLICFLCLGFFENNSRGNTLHDLKIILILKMQTLANC